MIVYSLKVDDPQSALYAYITYWIGFYCIFMEFMRRKKIGKAKIDCRGN